MQTQIFPQIFSRAVWRWKIISYLFLAGMGAGAYSTGLVADFMGYTWAWLGISIGVPLIIIGIPLLIWDLGCPRIFYLVFRNGKSWLMRGSIILTAFIAVGSVNIGFIIWPSILPSIRDILLGIEAAGFIIAIMIALYTGILLLSMRIPLWNNPMLPILFLFSSFTTGIGIILLSLPAFYGIGEIFQLAEVLVKVDVVLIILELLIIGLYLRIARGGRVPESINLLTSGGMVFTFWGGVIVIGLVVPLILESLYLFITLSALTRFIMLEVSCACLLIGGWLMRYAFVVTGRPLLGGWLMRYAFVVTGRPLLGGIVKIE